MDHLDIKYVPYNLVSAVCQVRLVLFIDCGLIIHGQHTVTLQMHEIV